MKTNLIAAIALCACMSTHANFVDERKEATDARPASASVPAAMPLSPIAPIAPEQVPGKAPPPQWDVAVADVSLLNTFKRWAVTAGYRIKWDAMRHVLVEAPGVVAGTFEEALEQVLSSPGIRNSEYPLEVCFYPNSPPLARITRRGDQVKDCI